jgi:hypothetical protein
VDSVTYLLIADGSSDVVLQHIINWLLRDLLPDASIEANFCEPAMLKTRPAGGRPVIMENQRVSETICQHQYCIHSS